MGQNSKNLIFPPFWWYWKFKDVFYLECHFHPWKCFLLVFGGPGIKSEDKNWAHYSQNATFTLEMPLQKSFTFHWRSEVPGSNSKMGKNTKNPRCIWFWWNWKPMDTLQPKYHFYRLTDFPLILKDPASKSKMGKISKNVLSDSDEFDFVVVNIR